MRFLLFIFCEDIELIARATERMSEYCINAIGKALSRFLKSKNENHTYHSYLFHSVIFNSIQFQILYQIPRNGYLGILTVATSALSYIALMLFLEYVIFLI